MFFYLYHHLLNIRYLSLMLLIIFLNIQFKLHHKFNFLVHLFYFEESLKVLKVYFELIINPFFLHIFFLKELYIFDIYLCIHYTL